MTIRRFTQHLGLVLAVAASACGSNTNDGGESLTGGRAGTSSLGGAGAAAGGQTGTGGKSAAGGTSSGGAQQGGTAGKAMAGSSGAGGSMGGTSAGGGGSGGAGKAAQGGGGAAQGGAAGAAGGAGTAAGGAGASAGGGAGAPMAGTAGTAGSAGGTCEKGQVKGNEVLWIGDSWIQIPGNQYTAVRDLARQAGALGASEDYVNRAVSGSPIGTIINQYTTYQSGSTKVKVLVMDGGGIDVMQGGKSQASVDGVISKVKDHFAKLASDGTVKHVIYYLYPQLPASGPGADVGPKLEPGIEAACAASSVPCHFLYLEPLFMGHPEYIGSDNLHPSQSGARVIAEAIWEIMQENCIAQ